MDWWCSNLINENEEIVVEELKRLRIAIDQLVNEIHTVRLNHSDFVKDFREFVDLLKSRELKE